MRNCAALLALILSSSVIVEAAATTSGRTDVFYDANRNVIYATASSNPDYNTQYYYTIRIRTYLTKKGLTQASANWGYLSGQTGPGSVYVEAPAESGVEFTAYTYYQGVIKYHTYQVISCPGCNDWYDAYGYNVIARTGDSQDEGPTFSVWVWASPLIIERVLEQVFDLGDSGGKKRAPGQAIDFDVGVRSFIPVKWVDGPEVAFGAGGCTGIIYKGDNRTYERMTFNVRTYSQVILLPDLGSYISPTYKYTGVSKRYDKTSGLSNGQLVADSVLHDCYRLDNVGSASIGSMNITVTGNAGTRSSTAHVYGGANNPLVPPPYPSPNIDWDATVTASKAVPTSPQYTIQIRHDCYPAHEVFIGQQLIHNHMPGSNTISYITSCLNGVGPVVSGPRSGPIN